MLKIGLTGGIGCGKSTVCELFAQLGVKIIDADLIARQLVTPGSNTLAILVEQFGNSILDSDGSLNRGQLRELVFADPEQKSHLDQIMHPLIYAEIDQQVQLVKDNYCILAIPLLLETQQMARVDRIAVVDCPVELQLARVMHRDHLSATQVLAIINSQLTREKRQQFADDIISNTGTTAQLAEQVKRLHNSYNLLATVRNSSA